MKEKLPSEDLPSYVKEVVNEVNSEYWMPTSIDEYLTLKKSSTIIAAWKEQQNLERKLRKNIGGRGPHRLDSL